MEHIKNNFGWYLLGIAVLIFVGYKTNWFGLGSKTESAPKDGDACMTKDSNGVQIPGTYQSGTCVPTPGGPGGPGGSGTGNSSGAV